MRHDVVVLGAGYAGLPAAKRIARQVRADEVRVTLVNATEEFVERPRLHQLAVGQPLRVTTLAQYLDGSGVDLRIGVVAGIDLPGRQVSVVADGRTRAVPFDTLVYGLGSTIDVGTVPGVAEFAHVLTGPGSAAALLARLRTLPAGGVVAVCGGGSTGIEVAAEVAEAFPALTVRVVTAGEPGGQLSAMARRHVRRAFETLGVVVMAGRRVEEVTAHGVVLCGGEELPCEVCVWAGGFTVPSQARDAGLAVTAAGRALVDETLRSVSHPEVTVVGDAAAVAGPWGPELAMGCRTGGFTGPQAADAIVARLTGRATRPFRFRYLHECVSLGRRHGLVQFLHADGTPADRILTGRLAIGYKNATLDAARWVFRRPGPTLPRRRHVVAAPNPVRSAVG